jgi:hypothetical protein
LERIRQRRDREVRTAEDADEEERGVAGGGRGEEHGTDADCTKPPARRVHEDRSVS